MKLTRYVFGAMLALTASCSGNDTQIAENTFVHGHKIYKMIDNELREVGDLNASEIKKFEVSQPKQRDLGTSDLSFVKPGASTSLKALYRGNYLYYSLQVNGINDLRDSYLPGRFTLEFVDEYGFILHAIEIPVTDLVGMVDDSGKPESFIYNGKTEMSTEINAAIKKYEVTASIKKI